MVSKFSMSAFQSQPAVAQDALVAALTDVGAEIDNDIVEKLTGKAAQYFAGVIGAINS